MPSSGGLPTNQTQTFAECAILIAILICKKVWRWFDKWLKNMVIPTGIEPVTYRLGICRSILLSYGTTRPDT